MGAHQKSLLHFFAKKLMSYCAKTVILFEIDKSKIIKLRENNKQRITIEWSSLSPFMNSNEKKYKLNKNHIGKKIILEIPCFDENLALKFFPFHVSKTKYPFISCEIASADKDYYGK